jgi:DNA repair ATPase RecN
VSIDVVFGTSDHRLYLLFSFSADFPTDGLRDLGLVERQQTVEELKGKYNKLVASELQLEKMVKDLKASVSKAKKAKEAVATEYEDLQTEVRTLEANRDRLATLKAAFDGDGLGWLS